LSTSDIHNLYTANDQIIIISTISQTEVIAKKMELYSGMATETEVRDFFRKRSTLMKKTTDDLRKHLDRLGGH
jgi:ligand-binding SRPBCC domain-containing protein